MGKGFEASLYCTKEAIDQPLDRAALSHSRQIFEMRKDLMDVILENAITCSNQLPIYTCAPVSLESFNAEFYRIGGIFFP